MARRIAYIISRFPTITETFVLNEMLELERLGMQIDVFSLIHEPEDKMQPGSEKFTPRAHYPNLSWGFFAAQFYWLFKNPRQYLSLWFKTIRGNLGSLKFLSRAVAAVPIGAFFARDIEALAPDHLHAHFATHPTLVAYVVHHLTGIPYSLTAHAHDLYAERAMLDEKLAHSKKIITISDYNRHLLHDLYGSRISDKTSIVRCGIDPSRFQMRAAKVPGDTLQIVCVGSLRDYKGQSYLVDACAILRDKNIAFQCLFVGDGDDRADLEAQISRLKLEDSVKILGYLTSDKVISLLNEADAFVLPSVITPSGKMEGIPVALMEALASGVPTITTNISGIPELVINEETGLLVPERDASALAEALIRFKHEPQLGQKLAAKGREHVCHEFELSYNAKKLYEIFTTLE